MIVSDDLYDAIAEEISPETEVLSINGQSIKDNEALFLDLSEYLNDSPYLQGNSHRIHEIFSLSSSTFLLLGFLVILFFIATGSILYFNNLSAISDSKADYEILRKIGYTDRTVKKIIKKQTISFFSIQDSPYAEHSERKPYSVYSYVYRYSAYIYNLYDILLYDCPYLL